MWRRRKVRKRPSGILIRIFTVVFILLIPTALFFLIFKIGLINIKEVRIENNQLGCANDNQIRDSSNLLEQNYFLVNPAKTEKNLKKKFFCIKSLIISKKFPNQAVLEVVSRQPFAKLIDLKEELASPSSLIENMATPSGELIQDYYIVDQEGVIFSKGQDDLEIPKIYINNLKLYLGKNLTDDLIVNPLMILDKVKAFGIDAKESFLRDELFVINHDPLQPRIIFRLDKKIDVQLASLQLILSEAKINSEELEFIDLRFDKPVVRFTQKK